MGEGSNLRIGIHVRSRKRANGVFVGLILIGLGAMFLAQKLGAIEWARADRLWPAVFFVLALSQIVERKLGSAVLFGMFGVWFFACIFGWWGFTYHNSWPILLVAAGASMAIGALTGEDEKRRELRGERDEDRT